MNIYFFTKAVGYQRRNVLNMFSNTLIVIYKGCYNLCVFFLQMASCTSFSIFIEASEHTKKLFIAVI